jgi:DNA-directed RNA polymerase specialized sigma24 family protein
MPSRKTQILSQPNVRKKDAKQMKSNTRSENINEAFTVSQADLKTLEMWISRYRRLLYFIAYRVVGNHTDAEQAVQSSIRTIPHNVPSLEHEGGFRAWLVRVVINEALAILRKNRLRFLVKGSARGHRRGQPGMDPCGESEVNAWTAVEHLRPMGDAYEF